MGSNRLEKFDLKKQGSDNQYENPRDYEDGAESVSDSFTIKGGIPGSTLKIIAVVSMLIDHLAYGILFRYMIINGYNSFVTVAQKQQWLHDNAVIYYSYEICRLIGRLSFPIFCFLLIEGVYHTSNKLKYGIRLLIFCFISEIPFDLAFWGTPFHMEHQNVFFTLFLGYVGVCLLKKWDEYVATRDNGLLYIVRFGIVCIIALIAHLLKTDYSVVGIITIFAMYELRFSRIAQCVGASLILMCNSLMEASCFVIMPIMIQYNGKRGLHVKYFFYIFYPAHLLIIYLINVCLGFRGWFF